MNPGKLKDARACVDALNAKAHELFPEAPSGSHPSAVRSDDMAEFARYVYDALDAIQLALES